MKKKNNKYFVMFFVAISIVIVYFIFIYEPKICEENKLMCSSINSLICSNNVWVQKETCSYKCELGICLEQPEKLTSVITTGDSYVSSSFADNQGFAYQTLVGYFGVGYPFQTEAISFYEFQIPNLNITLAKLKLHAENSLMGNKPATTEIKCFETSNFEELEITWDTMPELGFALSIGSGELGGVWEFDVTNFVKENKGQEVNIACQTTNKLSNNLIGFVAREKPDSINQAPRIDLIYMDN